LENIFTGGNENGKEMETLSVVCTNVNQNLVAD